MPVWAEAEPPEQLIWVEKYRPAKFWAAEEPQSEPAVWLASVRLEPVSAESVRPALFAVAPAMASLELVSIEPEQLVLALVEIRRSAEPWAVLVWRLAGSVSPPEVAVPLVWPPVRE